MRGFIAATLIVASFLAIEALYRWLNVLELSWAWAGQRAAFLAVIMLVTAWSSARKARRERRAGTAKPSLPTAILFLLLGAGGLVAWAWTIVGGLWTGQIWASNVPDVYTAWSDNPWGFVVTLGFGLGGFAISLFLFVGGLFTLRNYFAWRKGPAWP